jgi:hypothetical protein
MQAIHNYPPGRPQRGRTALNARLAYRFQTILVADGKSPEPGACACRARKTACDSADAGSDLEDNGDSH